MGGGDKPVSNYLYNFTCCKPTAEVHHRLFFNQDDFTFEGAVDINILSAAEIPILVFT